MDSEDKKTGHPFKTPENYFEEMESRILAEISLQKLVKKDSPFTAGDDFFNRLERDILSKTTQPEEKSQSLKVTYKRSWNRVYRIASGFLIFLGLGTGYYYYTSNQVGIDDLSNEEMVAYLEYESISSAEIANLIEPSAFDTDDIIPEDLEINENDVYFEAEVNPKKSI